VPRPQTFTHRVPFPCRAVAVFYTSSKEDVVIATGMVSFQDCTVEAWEGHGMSTERMCELALRLHSTCCWNL